MFAQWVPRALRGHVQLEVKVTEMARHVWFKWHVGKVQVWVPSLSYQIKLVECYPPPDMPRGTHRVGLPMHSGRAGTVPLKKGYMIHMFRGDEHALAAADDCVMVDQELTCWLCFCGGGCADLDFLTLMDFLYVAVVGS